MGSSRTADSCIQAKHLFLFIKRSPLSEGTVEERILKLQARKQALVDNLFDAEGAATPRWSNQDLEFLFEPL